MCFCVFARTTLFVLGLLFVFCVFCFLLLSGCQYPCSQLPGKTHLWDDILCVEWDIKPYTLTHSLIAVLSAAHQ